MAKEKIILDVTCPCEKRFTFEKIITIEAGTSESHKSEIEAYCPGCGNYVMVKTPGKAGPETTYRGSPNT